MYVGDEPMKLDLTAGELTALITSGDTITHPQEIDSEIDSDGRLWVVYKASDGAIKLAVSNDDYTGWLFDQRLLYVPTGSSNPSITFNDQGEYLIAAEILPAGLDKPEIWLYEPPYSGDGVRRIVDGQSPVLARDQRGVIHLFYQIPDQNEIRYRNGIDGFISEMLFPQSDLEYPYPAGFRTIMNQYESYLEYKYILFSNQVGNALPHYTMTNYTAVSKNDSSISAMASIGGLQWESYAFYVTIQLRDYFRKTPIEDAVIIFRGQQYVTDAGGKIDLGLIGAYPSDTILLQHEDYPDTTFEFQITEDTEYVFEVMGVLGATESLNVSPVVTGIEWELMLVPIRLYIYNPSTGEPISGATVHFAGQVGQSGLDGMASFYNLKAGDFLEYEISHPDYEVINTGKLLIPEGTDIVFPVQMFHDLPNYPCEVVSANPEVSLVEWVDARYTVTIRVVSYETGTTMAGSSVVFAGETKTTDENGEAVFHLVKPFPTVNLYEIQIDGFPVANVRVTGHESTREITILIQAGAETVPKAVADFAEMVPGITSILWVEVE